MEKYTVLTTKSKCSIGLIRCSMYEIEYTIIAKEHIQKLRHSEPAAFKKAAQLLLELVDHPKTGTGHPEPLKGDDTGKWSRRISKKHRLVYEIMDQTVLVLILTAYGHYNDK